jgi:hypothetical protein
MPGGDPFESPDQYIAQLRNSPEVRGAVARGKVQRLAEHDPVQALQVARSIEHPWYRCQAIASIVEMNPTDQAAESLLDEAFAAAYGQDEPNRIASVALWPLRLLVHRAPGKAAAHARELLQIISREPHGLRKLDGLHAILVAVAPSKDLRELVLQPFETAAEASRGWRTERIIDDMAVMLIPFDRDAAMRLVGSRLPSRYTRRSRALLSPST